MKVILLDNITNIGNKYDIKSVADGYARNFLFPRGLARLATKSALRELEKRREAEKTKQEQELKKFQEIAKKLDGQEIEIPMKQSEDGKLYGSVTSHKIAEVLREKGFNVDKEQIVLKELIGEVGEYGIALKFPHNLEANVKVIVINENKL